MSQSKPKDSFSVSRRFFLKSFGTSAAVAATAQVEAVAAELEKANTEKVYGPGTVPITLQVNGKPLKLNVEPRVMLLDDKPVYSCSKLAIDSQGSKITTVEGLARDGKLTPVQQAFIDQDALMCGFCTPGFIMSVTALLKQNPRPSADQVKHACSGNLCRCGTYPRVLQAALKAAGVPVANKTEVISYAKLA